MEADCVDNSPNGVCYSLHPMMRQLLEMQISPQVPLMLSRRCVVARAYMESLVYREMYQGKAVPFIYPKSAEFIRYNFRKITLSFLSDENRFQLTTLGYYKDEKKVSFKKLYFHLWRVRCEELNLSVPCYADFYRVFDLLKDIPSQFNISFQQELSNQQIEDLMNLRNTSMIEMMDTSHNIELKTHEMVFIRTNSNGPNSKHTVNFTFAVPRNHQKKSNMKFSSIGYGYLDVLQIVGILGKKDHDWKLTVHIRFQSGLAQLLKHIVNELQLLSAADPNYDFTGEILFPPKFVPAFRTSGMMDDEQLLSVVKLREVIVADNTAGLDCEFAYQNARKCNRLIRLLTVQSKAL